jgi:BirA family biotin operon repressor/biotin-[acetyl-CoA-carboxylase] ligase
MSAQLFPLLRKLGDRHFHSGEDLAADFGVSRATINNLIHQAMEMGVRLQAVKGQGYRLADACEWLDAARLRGRLKQAGCELDIDVVDRIGSTNSELMERLRSGSAPSILCAEYQTAGRGRRGRHWIAAPGGSLMFSMSWRFEQPVGELGGLSLAAGLALVRAMAGHCGGRLELKWPNDIVSGFRKLAGILVEIQGEAAGPSAVVIGAGINLKLPPAMRTEISQGVVDMEELGWSEQRNDLLADCLLALAGTMDEFARAGFGVMREAWNELHAYHGRRVGVFFSSGEQQTGSVVGVDETGALLMRDGAGEVRRYSGGEISLRPADRTPS